MVSVVVVVAAPTHENLCMYTTVELLSDICALTVKRKLRQEKHTHTHTNDGNGNGDCDCDGDDDCDGVCRHRRGKR